MKKYFLSSGFAAVLILGACSDTEEADSTETSSDGTNTEAFEQLQTENEELKKQVEDLEMQLTNVQEASEEPDEVIEESSDAVENESSRSNPLALGETTEVNVVTYNDDGEALRGVATVTVDNVVRGQEALDMLDTEYTYTEAPEEEGVEYAVFDLTYELVEFEDEDYPVNVSDDIEIYLEDGSMFDQTGYTWVDGEEFPTGEMYSGGTASGKVARMAPEGEPFIIKYDDYIEAQAFFQVE